MSNEAERGFFLGHSYAVLQDERGLGRILHTSQCGDGRESLTQQCHEEKGLCPANPIQLLTRAMSMVRAYTMLAARTFWNSAVISRSVVRAFWYFSCSRRFSTSLRASRAAASRLSASALCFSASARCRTAASFASASCESQGVVVSADVQGRLLTPAVRTLQYTRSCARAHLVEPSHLTCTDHADVKSHWSRHAAALLYASVRSS